MGIEKKTFDVTESTRDSTQAEATNSDTVSMAQVPQMMLEMQKKNCMLLEQVQVLTQAVDSLARQGSKNVAQNLVNLKNTNVKVADTSSGSAEN